MAARTRNARWGRMAGNNRAASHNESRLQKADRILMPYLIDKRAVFLWRWDGVGLHAGVRTGRGDGWDGSSRDGCGENIRHFPSTGPQSIDGGERKGRGGAQRSA